MRKENERSNKCVRLVFLASFAHEFYSCQQLVELSSCKHEFKYFICCIFVELSLDRVLISSCQSVEKHEVKSIK